MQVDRITILKMPRITRALTLTNLAIGSSAICFQVLVLYPWHMQLNKSFSQLRHEHNERLLDCQIQQARDFREIRSELEALRKVHNGGPSASRTGTAH